MHLPEKSLLALRERGHTGTYKFSGSKVYFDDGNVFLLKSAPRFSAEQMIGEARSLRDMSTALPGICPALIDSSLDDDSSEFYMLTEWHDLGGSSSRMMELGKELAQMHLNGTEKSGKFGYEMPTYCGETKFNNKWNDNWIDFLNNDRFGYLFELICGEDGTADGELWKLGQTLMKKSVPSLLKDVDAKPSLLHGDLWAGNASYSRTTDRPIVFDACSFYGHNEVCISDTQDPV